MLIHADVEEYGLEIDKQIMPTIGGYNKIGTIFSLNMFKLSQKTTGEYIQFEGINIQHMQKEKLVFDKFFQK